MDWSQMTNLDPNTIKVLETTKESLTLRESISVEELYGLMEQAKTQFPGNFKLKKGVFGTSIVFDKYMGFGTTVRVKETKIHLKRMNPSSNSKNRKNRSLAHLVNIAKTAQSVGHAIKTGEINEDLLGGPNYFRDICEVMRELLQSSMR